jgi:hypothetical protein
MARGGYTPKQIREMDDDELSFVYHYMLANEERMFQRLLSALGITWDLEEIKASTQATKSTGSGKAAKLYVPLAVGVNPEMYEWVKKQAGGGQNALIGGGEYVPKAGEVVKPMSEMGKDEFMNLLGRKSASQIEKDKRERSGKP